MHRGRSDPHNAMIRIIHAADLHLDSPFESLDAEKASVRRSEQRALLERIAAEAEAPVADVMFGGGVESLLAYEDYFAPCDAPRAAMLESCRFEAHRFVAFSRLPLVIIYNPRLVSSPPAGFADLLESRLRGRIAFANPGVSGSSFTVLATLIQALGDEDALGRFADNVRGHELSSSGEVVSAVAAGEMRVGVTLYETAKKRMLAGEHIAVVWP